MSFLQNSTVFLKVKCLREGDVHWNRNHGKRETVWQEMVDGYTRKTALHIIEVGPEWKRDMFVYTDDGNSFKTAVWGFKSNIYCKDISLWPQSVLTSKRKNIFSIVPVGNQSRKPCKVHASEVRIYWETLCWCWEQQRAGDKMINTLLLLSRHLSAALRLLRCDTPNSKIVELSWWLCKREP